MLNFEDVEEIFVILSGIKEDLEFFVEWKEFMKKFIEFYKKSVECG